MQLWMTLLRSVLWLPLLVWLWLRDYSQNVAVATMAIPGVFLGAWALRFYNLSAQRQCILHKPCSHLDPVTGTLNHGSIHQILQQQSLQALRYQYPLSLVYLDIDRFSLFNATYGHDVGDQLLRRMAHTLRSLLPPGAFLGRYDADEFLVLLPHTGRAQALIIARQLAERIHQSVLLQASNGQVVPVTVSIGVACLPEDAPSVPELLSAAQSALLLAQQHQNSVADIHFDWRARYRIHLDGAFSTLEALITAIDHKDHYTRRHSEQVAEFAQWIAEELDLPEEQQHALRLAGLVHDVGKIGIPDEVLQKPDLLTAEEYETMKQHPVLGAVMLAALPGMEHLAPLVRSHHERWDGRGYPDGLAGEQIPFLARVLTVADAFSAMTTDRPYRRGMSWQSALLELQHQRGKQFDPMLVDAFVAAVHKRRLLEQHDSRELAAA